MAKDLRKGLGIALIAFASMFSFVSNVNAVSCPNGSYRAGEDVGSISECNLAKDHAGANDLMGTVNIIINVVLGVLGLLAVVVIIYGGFMYTTSVGDSSKIKKAKDTIMYGVIGLVIALLAFAIVNFVVSSIFK